MPIPRLLSTLPLLLLSACQDSAPRAPSSPTPQTSVLGQPPAPNTGSPSTSAADAPPTMSATSPSSESAPSLATFGAGCFWCVEAVLEQMEGVRDVSSGYMGGSKRPTYREVCTGLTPFAEVVQVQFDPAKISYATLLEWFWVLHDPTTLNRQGADEGPQYRSVIFVHDAEQRATAEASKRAAQADFKSPIVTEISDAMEFFAAEEYHQDYYRNNKSQGYCRAVITPKLKKLELRY
jgi:peptide-methionine (S)-S-oxide reductase